MITQIKRWLETAFPNPTEKDQATQIGVHLEEVTEFMEAIGSSKAATILVQEVSDNFKQSPNIYQDADGNQITLPEDFKEQMLDALCDQIVTATSVAHSMGFDIVGAIKEVNASNWSKFEDGKPLYDANGKVIKGKHYFKPNLKPFLTNDGSKTLTNDPVEPNHYKSKKHQCIEFSRHMPFNIGNAFKYVWRYTNKNGIEDLDKAAWYIKDYLANNKLKDVISREEYDVLMDKLTDCGFMREQYLILHHLITFLSNKEERRLNACLILIEALKRGNTDEVSSK
jgi:NTP pyrophosphatase (non-canonical NTP hydrolase)